MLSVAKDTTQVQVRISHVIRLACNIKILRYLFVIIIIFTHILCCNLYTFNHSNSSLTPFYLLSHFRLLPLTGGTREIQRTMLELLNQLDGFDERGDVKVRKEK